MTKANGTSPASVSNMSGSMLRSTEEGGGKVTTPEIPPPGRLFTRMKKVHKHRPFKLLPPETGGLGILVRYWNDAVMRGLGDETAFARDTPTVRPGKK